MVFAGSWEDCEEAAPAQCTGFGPLRSLISARIAPGTVPGSGQIIDKSEKSRRSIIGATEKRMSCGPMARR